MKYIEVLPCETLRPYVHSFWQLKGEEIDHHWERMFPDGCPGVVVNLGSNCLTDNGQLAMETGKTYAVGTTRAFKESYLDADTHLLGVCLKPGAFANLYRFYPQGDIVDCTVQLDAAQSFDRQQLERDAFHYLNAFLTNGIKQQATPLQAVLDDIHLSGGTSSVEGLAKRQHCTVRQLERYFKQLLGISPKEYSRIVRFQKAMEVMKNSGGHRSLADIAFACGYYDHAHLTHEIKRLSGLPPSEM